jgi:large subunit ribosomal protein L25
VKVLEAPEAVVVQLKLPGIEAAAPVVPAEPGAGPEVIKKEKKVDEEAGDEKK